MLESDWQIVGQAARARGVSVDEVIRGLVRGMKTSTNRDGGQKVCRVVKALGG